MNELIKINYESDRPTVLARDLHEFLEVGTPYDEWFPRMCEYGFAEGEDYSTFCRIGLTAYRASRDRMRSSPSIWQKRSVCFSATKGVSRRGNIFTNRKSVERSRHDNGEST